MDTFEKAMIQLGLNQYRTEEQFLEVMDDCFNGNFEQGARNFVQFGFSAHEYIERLEEYCEGLVNDNVKIELLKDLATLLEVKQYLGI